MHAQKTALVVLSLALTLSIAACNKGSDGAVLAKVNRGNITDVDFKRQLGELTPEMQQAVVSDPKARKEFLEDLIGIELVIQEAKKQNLDKDPEFKKKMETHKKELEEYKKKIEQQLQDASKNELFNGILKKELGEKLNKVAEPSDNDIKAYYEKNKDKIRTASGKQLSLKEIAPQIKMRLLQEKRREQYVEYAKGLKAKAKISVDEKALDAAITAFSKPADLSGMTVTKVPSPAKDATKK